jgi:putative pyruvate formate lyase activating enzyme
VNAERIERALPGIEQILRECCLCGHRCRIDRHDNAAGFCRTTSADRFHARYSSHTLHFGEEPLLVGRGGSGTVFFTHCNLRCAFCQNFQISQLGLGDDLHYTRLARIFLQLQRDGAENINLVTPTHYIYPILLGLRDAQREGLNRPLVYNTNGYDSLELLALLEGVVDIYLPDLKYTDEALARKYSSAEAYPETAQKALREMYRQVGPVVESNGVATRGLIIRHLLLPENIAGSYDFLLWLRTEGMHDVTLSLMSQYSPQHRAAEFPELRARVAPKDYRDVVRYALDLGFEHLLTQGIESADLYLPDFKKDRPFAD